MPTSKAPDNRQDPASALGRKAANRKPYQPPRLQVFGSVAKLTGAKAGSGADGSMQMM